MTGRAACNFRPVDVVVLWPDELVVMLGARQGYVAPFPGGSGARTDPRARRITRAGRTGGVKHCIHRAPALVGLHRRCDARSTAREFGSDRTFWRSGRARSTRVRRPPCRLPGWGDRTRHEARTVCQCWRRRCRTVAASAATDASKHDRAAANRRCPPVDTSWPRDMPALLWTVALGRRRACLPAPIMRRDRGPTMTAMSRLGRRLRRWRRYWRAGWGDGGLPYADALPSWWRKP
jgi:hypothetical protein